MSRDSDTEVRALLRRAIKSSGKSRPQIAYEMTERLERPAERPITEYMLNDFTRKPKAERRENRFPAAWVRTFCEITGNDELGKALLSDRLRRVLNLGSKKRTPKKKS